MAQSITDRISAEYDRIRSDAKVARIKRISEIHEKFPELEKLRLDIVNAGQSAAMELSKNIDKEDEIRQKLEKTVEALENRRMEIIKEKMLKRLVQEETSLLTQKIKKQEKEIAECKSRSTRQIEQIKMLKKKLFRELNK